MSKKNRPVRPKARLPKGLTDTGAGDIRAMQAMLGKIRAVYERYGFEPLETPAFEYTDALGKFLPDLDRPNEGVFSFQDEDEQWLSLRYDLTAPLARYVAQNYNELPKPFRRYQVGPVWRNEKPGPGRFRQFLQFDADTVGAPTVAADAEMCMLAADALEELGIKRGDYVIKVNNRKVLDGVLEAIGVTDEGQKLTVLRAVDKLDRLGEGGVQQLLGKGRKDESGDFTKGAELTDKDIDRLGRAYRFFSRDWKKPFSVQVYRRYLKRFAKFEHSSGLIDEGLEELEEIRKLVRIAGYETDRIVIDPSIVRGLEYYTGPVFEAELTFETVNIETDSETGSSKVGLPTRFGSVGGGGRYDGLVARFRGQEVPATGFSIGVSRLLTALREYEFEARGYYTTSLGPVVVAVFDRDSAADSQKLVAMLREAGIRAEMYLGNPKNMGAQFKYADQRGSPCAVIQGPDEKDHPDGPMVQIKDLIEGAKAAAAIASNEEWRESRQGQFAVKESELVEAVRGVIARHRDR